MANRKQTAVRLTEDQDKQLTAISELLKLPRNEVIVNLIMAEHDRLMGNPELLKLVDKMNELKDQIEKLGKGQTSDQGEKHDN